MATSDWTPPVYSTPTDGSVAPLNIMETGTAWLTEQLFDHATIAANYVRGASSVELDVVRAQTTADLNTEYGLNIDVRVADFLIQQEDLILGAVEVKPDRGDEISIVVGNETVTYEVLASITENEYRESDRFGNTFRVHTKETGRV